MITGLGSAENLVSGKQGAFYYTLQELHRYWDRIDIIAPRSSNVKEKSEVFFGNVYVHVSPWPLILHPIFFLRKGFQLWKQHRFDLITVQEFPPFYNGIGARILHALTGVPYVLEIMHIPGLPHAASLKEIIYRWLAKVFISFDAQAARAVRVINKNQTRDFLIQAGVPKSKIYYIPAFYIDLNIFKPEPVEKKYDLVYAARLEKNKGISNLIEAVKILKRDKPDISLLVIGSGPLKSVLERSIRRNGLEGTVAFAGWLETAQDVARTYQSARVFVNPALNEGGPRVVLEAMACGMPIITTPVGLMPDIIRDGENGIISGFSSQELAQAITRVLNEPDMGKRLAEAGSETVKEFERSAAIKNYADALGTISQKRLLVITQKVDEKDQLLGFFIEWLRRLSKETDLSVLCLQKGVYELNGILVDTMGKERGVSKVGQLWNFYQYIITHRDEYDSVLVHMNPIWAALGGPVWRLMNKKVILWYTHKAVTLKLRIAHFFAHRVLTASSESFRLKSHKVVVTGHGIDTELFKPGTREHHDELRILSVGRIAPVKNYEVLIEALSILDIPFHLTIAGEAALPSDVEYEKKIKNLIKEKNLENNINFIGRIDHQNLPELYRSHELFVHMSKTGSLDKTLLEAMASGLSVVSSNDAAKTFLPQAFLFDENDATDLAEKIKTAGNADGKFREYVIAHHNLSSLILKIISAL